MISINIKMGEEVLETTTIIIITGVEDMITLIIDNKETINLEGGKVETVNIEEEVVTEVATEEEEEIIEVKTEIMVAINQNKSLEKSRRTQTHY